MRDLETTVLYNRPLAGETWQMGLLAPDYDQLARPGQFVMLRLTAGSDPLLRRPFGIFRCRTLPPLCTGQAPQPAVELLYKVVGRGTRLLSSLHSGDRVALLGPLGRGFDLTDCAPTALLVAGGIGVAPLYLLAEQLLRQGRQVRLLLGGRRRDDILAVTEFERLGVETYVATDDGSLGEQGLVTQVLERKLARFPQASVFACGPMAMLRAVERLCRQAAVPLQVSLEALMACGVGACLGCVVPGQTHQEDQPDYRCTCKQGPVFDAQELLWPQEDRQ